MTRLVAFFLATTLLAAQTGVQRTFDADQAGAPPPGFTFVVARAATPDRWRTQAVDDGLALTHEGETGGPDGLAIAVIDGVEYRDVEVAARLKIPGGRGAGGLVWRYRDADNCYLVELDLEEQDIDVYRLVRGNRIRLEGEDDLELDPNAWHTLRVVHEEETIGVYLGGIRVLRTRDRTFRSAGRVGVWSAGVATVHFDDLRAGRED
jgi:hypothetical protein